MPSGKCLLSKLQNTIQPSSLNSAPSKFLVLSLKSFISMEYAQVCVRPHKHTHTHKYSHSFRHWSCFCKSPDTIMVISFISLPTHLTASPILHTSHAPGQHKQPECTTEMKLKLHQSISGSVSTNYQQPVILSQTIMDSDLWYDQFFCSMSLNFLQHKEIC